MMVNLESLKEQVKQFKYIDYLRTLKSISEQSWLSTHTPFRVFILRSYSAEMIEPVLKLSLIHEGYHPEFFWGDYNQYAQEILDETSSLYANKPDLILLLIRIEDLMPDLIWKYVEKNYREWKKKIDHTIDLLTQLFTTLSHKTSAQIIIQNMSLPGIPYWGIYDAQDENSQSDLLQYFNKGIRKKISIFPTIYIWDYHNFIMRKGYETIFEPKLMFFSSNPFKQSAYIEIAYDLGRYIFSALGKNKKCIVLDLDNTLWGGVVGEDGIQGISLGHDYPGNCFVDFQKELLKLYHRGIILAINSKNNESDAFEVFDNHPDMVLQKKHFAAWQINWSDKANNIQQLAKDLNIGIDSMIFIDDNPAECEWVKSQCPECTVVQLPKQYYLLPSIIKTLPGIDRIKLTDEDKKKGAMYQAQIKRKNLKNSASDLGTFLHELMMEIVIKKSEPFTVPRISQLTQKTNQFNMTTRRYTEQDIMAFDNASKHHVFSVSSQDRFGDNGIVGVIILKFEEKICIIDTFLLSCRVIARTIEQSMIAFVADFAQKNGAEKLIGEYIPTAKNKPACDVYLKMNMQKDGANRFVADLKHQKFEYSQYLKLIIDD
jgi:FkbH-like protein